MRKILLGLAIAAGIGCGSDSTSPHANLDGLYQLVTVNGNALPYVADTITSERRVILSRRVNLTVVDASSGSISITTVTQQTLGGTTSTGSNQEGYAITFTGPNTFTYDVTCVTPSAACAMSGVGDGSILTITAGDGTQWRYTR